MSDQILGYDKDRNPIYPPQRGYVYTQAFILCSECRKPISGSGGPSYGSVCPACYEKEKMQENTDEYDVVVDVLKKHHDKLWDMSKNKEEWGIMDHIRLEQMDKLKRAIDIWKEHKDE